MKCDLTGVSMLKPSSFKLILNNADFTNIEYFCTIASIPTVDLPAAASNFKNVFPTVSGESLAFSNLSVTFIVDEDMKNYIEAFNWLKYNANNDITKYIDATLLVLGNKNKVKKSIQFKNCIPVSLAAIEFNVQDDSEDYITCSLDIAYSSFEISE